MWYKYGKKFEANHDRAMSLPRKRQTFHLKSAVGTRRGANEKTSRDFCVLKGGGGGWGGLKDILGNTQDATKATHWAG